MNNLKIALVFLLTFVMNANAEENKFFSATWNDKSIDAVLVNNWHPYPTCSERKEWENVPLSLKTKIINEAESHLGKPFAFLPASEFLSYVRDGNRSRFQALTFGRREQLSILVLAECLEGKGRFMDDIANGIWSICEETYWGVPAHVNAQRVRAGLPDITEPTIDLFAAETASLLAISAYLLKPQLNKVSSLIVPRIEYETARRILEPYRMRDDFGWMGFSGSSVNNWNPWINSNVLFTTLLLEKDKALKTLLVAKTLRSLDYFVDKYPSDGGCDEGPSYWGKAGASLFDCMDVLYNASNSKINFYDKQIIRNIGQYIYKAHIAKNNYVNYADGSAATTHDGLLVYRYGEAIGDEKMMQFGSYLLKEQNGLPRELYRNPIRVLPYLFITAKMPLPIAPLLKTSWLPDLQVLFAREAESSAQGLYFSAKGGHNAESHNHNDVGTFILYSDGIPVIVDAGVGNYTSKTFSKDRYSIWSMQSQFHNLPTINGEMQRAGKEFCAKNVVFKNTKAEIEFQLDLASAYPAEACVKNWIRSYSFKDGKGLFLSDNFELSKTIIPTSWNFITCMDVEQAKPGCIVLKSNAFFAIEKSIQLQYPSKKMKVEVETITIAPDEGFGYWKGTLKRIKFTEINSRKVDNVNFSFKVIE